MEKSWLNKLRVFAAFAVVVVHTSAEMLFGSSVIGTSDWTAGLFYNSLSRWSVPVFVMISGALLLENKDESYGSFYRKRLRRIIPPLIFWSVIYLGLDMLTRIQEGNPMSALYALKRMITGHPALHLWYLFMLIGLYTVTPLLQKLLNRFQQKMVIFITVSSLLTSIGIAAVLTFVFELSSLYILPRIPFIFWFIPYLGFFISAHVLIKMDKMPSRIFLWAVFASSVMACFIPYRYFSLRGEMITALFYLSFFGPAAIFMAISMFFIIKTVPQKVLPVSLENQLSKLTLGIYLIHPLFLRMFLPVQHTDEGVSQWIVIPMLSLSIFAVSALASLVFSRLPILKHTI